jgi:hypothetical protein
MKTTLVSEASIHFNPSFIQLLADQSTEMSKKQTERRLFVMSITNSDILQSQLVIDLLKVDSIKKTITTANDLSLNRIPPASDNHLDESLTHHHIKQSNHLIITIEISTLCSKIPLYFTQFFQLWLPDNRLRITWDLIGMVFIIIQML